MLFASNDLPPRKTLEVEPSHSYYTRPGIVAAAPTGRLLGQPLDPHCAHYAEKALATIADLMMFVGAVLLAKEAFARESDMKEVAEAHKALLNSALANHEFVNNEVVFRSTDPNLKDKLENINVRRNRKALWPGILLTALGFGLHILSLWV